MKNLARHIEQLLRDNDCVILPGFGGFIAHDMPAFYVNEEGLYYPPSRTISFNAAITMNDGLLVQSYMKCYQVDYARATYMVDVAIEQLTDTLDEEGTATLHHIGTLRQDIQQVLQFTPDQTGIASPKHFGLGSFIIKELSQLHQTTGVTSSYQPRTAKTINLHKHRNMLHRVISTAAIFLLLLMIALPTGMHQPTDIAALRLTEIISVPQSQISEITSAEATPLVCDTLLAIEIINTAETSTAPLLTEVETITTSEEKIQATENIESPIEETAPLEVTTILIESPEAAPTVSTTIEKTYHIIVASLPSYRGAEETLHQYTDMGYAGASLVERDNRVRISLMQFNNKAEANRQLDILRQHSKFQNAWLLAVRN